LLVLKTQWEKRAMHEESYQMDAGNQVKWEEENWMTKA